MTPGTPATRPEHDGVRQQSASCGRCSARWSGTAKAHCAASGCHRTFSTVSNFDRHRTIDGERGACRDPQDIGLIDRDGIWGMPSDPANVERLRRLRNPDTSGLEYIRTNYSVPARVGVHVLLEGHPGVIVGGSGPHLLLQLEGDDGPVPAHPTWEIQYLNTVIQAATATEEPA